MKDIRKYLITLAIGLAMAGCIAFSKDVFNQVELSMVFHILTDSFFAPGILIVGFGALIFVSNEGVFDGLVYGITSFLDIFRKEKKNQYRTFFDYKEGKGNRDTKFGFLIICGMIFILISCLMLFLYHQNV